MVMLRGITGPITGPVSRVLGSMERRPTAFTIARLFAAGEQGVWYDPSDLSTLFQDAAGTTPVTAVEQPVGLMLDKSKGLVLGPELVVNGDFSQGLIGWTAVNSTLSVASAVLRITQTAVGAGASQSFPTTPGKTYIAKGVFVSDGITGSTFVRVNTAPLTEKNLFSSTGPFTFRFVATAATTTFSVASSGAGINGEYIDITSISVRELPGNHATQTTSTSRPVLKQDAGGQYYLKFDGVDDGMVTNSINFTATDKMTVFAGVRKLSDAAQAVVAELSVSRAANAGAFTLTAPNAPGDNFSWQARGSAEQSALIATPYSAPVTAVISATSDIPADSRVLRVNDAKFTSTADQGDGNFGNYPLYIGRRGGTTLPFNGHIYSLIVRGAATTDTRIAQTERWVNKKTGAY